MFKKIKEFNEQNTVIIFFAVMLILIILLFSNSFHKGNKTSINNNCTIPSNILDSIEKYLYDIKIDNNGEIIILSVKKYNNKYMIEKTEKGNLYNYYIYYTDVYIEDENDQYIPYKEQYIIQNIDNKFLLFDYLDELSFSSKITENDNEICYDNEKSSINMCISNNNNIITLKQNEMIITYEYRSSNVEDFELNLKDESNIIIKNDSSKEIENNMIEKPTNENNNEVMKNNS